MMKLGKNRGLQRLISAEGHFAMVAVDQRPPLAAVIAAARGVSTRAVSFADMCAAKRLIVEALAADASAMLFDPNFALPAAMDLLPPDSGMIVTLEEHRYEDTPGGRKSRAIEDWSVAKIRRMGADGVKVLAWYRPDAEADVVEHQQRFVEDVGGQCRDADIPFVLELLTYPLATEQTGPVYQEYAERSADLVVDSVREFACPRYQVDLLKLESPVPAASIPLGPDAADVGAVRAQFDAIGGICADAGIPWVMLSAGASRERFERVLEHAYAAGAQGFLAGRSIWLDCLAAFPDLAASRQCLQSSGRAHFQKLATLTRQKASAWEPRPGGFANVTQEGDFTRLYI